MNKQLLNLVSEMFNVPLTSKVLSTKNFLVLSIKPRFKKDQASLTKNGPLNTDFLLKDTVGKNLNCLKETLKNKFCNAEFVRIIGSRQHHASLIFCRIFLHF